MVSIATCMPAAIVAGGEALLNHVGNLQPSIIMVPASTVSASWCRYRKEKVASFLAIAI